MLCSSLRPLSFRRHCQAATSGRQTTRPRDSGTQVLEAKIYLHQTTAYLTCGTTAVLLDYHFATRHSTLDIVAWLRNCPPPSTRHPFPFRPRPSKGLHFLCGYIGSRNASDNYHSPDTVDIPHHHRCLSLILRLPLRSPLTGIIPHHGLAVTS